MASSHIIPIPGTTDADPVVLIEVTPIKGKHPLDLRLVGCEGESGYVTDIRHRDIGKLKKHNFKGSDQDWETLLSYFLLQKQPEGDQAKVLDDVRVAYTIKAEKLEITIHKDVQGIKVILGEISLELNEEEEIAPFEWAQTAAQSHGQALEEITRMKAELRNKQEVIDQLTAQLKDFIKAKNESETAMLQQFMQLLNEKKRKIRDQNRLLAGAKVDKEAATAVKAARQETKPRKAGASRESKRKAPAKTPVAEEEEEEASDRMEVDEVKKEEGEEESEQDDDSIPEASTPDRVTDDETDDDDNQDDGGAPASSVSQSRQQAETSGTKSGQSPKDASVPDAPPPIRELPFHRPTTRTQATKIQAPPAEDSDETEDEL
ncbi:hypothetical protein BU24DRAFT_422829 [Aaosphaeria arxii CBS 175.79]|uniref:XRCC4 coiled-coil domain-containing protein n=1 Tax=Aaosphaeria arxii CBS 175.79 TaxID=1450172 RepID=A0A6A5XUV7_9PLEO|nr:uncharacterized protein BU24DRAFT_422829 [Aaosphaeria arxii CBS 175.79]KAF2016491.1 hypothetical protein BU24DRAFT_422829 [Aaosphaeria arxii CBS 175.79]